jgi:hypothetical protein
MGITGKIDLQQIIRHLQLDGRLSPEGQSQAHPWLKIAKKMQPGCIIISDEVEEGVEEKLNGDEVEIE